MPIRINPWMDKLTPRQLHFCNYYLSGKYSARESMILAGYNEKYAENNRHNIFKCRKIIAFLKEEKERRAEQETLKQIDLHSHCLRKAMECDDPELAHKYLQEARQFEKQRKEFDLKIEELQQRAEASKNKLDEPNNPSQEIIIKVETAKDD